MEGSGFVFYLAHERARGILDPHTFICVFFSGPGVLRSSIPADKDLAGFLILGRTMMV